MSTRQSFKIAIAEWVAPYPWLARPLRATARKLRAFKHGRVVTPDLTPDLTSDFVGRAHALASASRHAEAVDVLEAGLRQYPKHMEAHDTLVQILVHLQQYERALDTCLRALTIDAES